MQGRPVRIARQTFGLLLRPFLRELSYSNDMTLIRTLMLVLVAVAFAAPKVQALNPLRRRPLQRRLRLNRPGILST